MLLPTSYQGNVHQRFARNHFETHVRQIYQLFKIATLFPKRDLSSYTKKTEKQAMYCPIQNAKKMIM